jgi:hypothetical protein
MPFGDGPDHEDSDRQRDAAQGTARVTPLPAMRTSGPAGSAEAEAGAEAGATSTTPPGSRAGNGPGWAG